MITIIYVRSWFERVSLLSWILSWIVSLDLPSPWKGSFKMAFLPYLFCIRTPRVSFLSGHDVAFLCHLLQLPWDFSQISMTEMQCVFLPFDGLESSMSSMHVVPSDVTSVSSLIGVLPSFLFLFFLVVLPVIVFLMNLLLDWSWISCM